MTYDPAIPQAGDDPAVSQAQLLTNAGQLNTIFALNHFEYNHVTVADRGKHRYISMVSQAPPVTGAGEGATYVNNTGATRQQLHYRRESNGIDVPISTYIGGFVRFSGGGVIVGDSFNIASVVRTAAGQYTINFTNNLTSGNYAVIVTPNQIGFPETFAQNMAINQFFVETRSNAGVLGDCMCSVLIIGEMA